MGYGIRAHKINRVRLAKKLVGTDGIFISQTNELADDNGQMPFERIDGTYLNSISGNTDFSDLNQIHNLKTIAVDNLNKSGIAKININDNSRDDQYLRSAMLGLYFWKINWIDSGIVKL